MKWSQIKWNQMESNQINQVKSSQDRSNHVKSHQVKSSKARSTIVRVFKYLQSNSYLESLKALKHEVIWLGFIVYDWSRNCIL